MMTATVAAVAAVADRHNHNKSKNVERQQQQQQQVQQQQLQIEHCCCCCCPSKIVFHTPRWRRGWATASICICNSATAIRCCTPHAACCTLQVASCHRRRPLDIAQIRRSAQQQQQQQSQMLTISFGLLTGYCTPPSSLLPPPNLTVSYFGWSPITVQYGGKR